MDKITTTDVYVPVTLPVPINTSIHWIEEEVDDLPISVAIEKQQDMVVLSVDQIQQIVVNAMWEQYCNDVAKFNWSTGQAARTKYIQSLFNDKP